MLKGDEDNEGIDNEGIDPDEGISGRFHVSFVAGPTADADADAAAHIAAAGAGG